MKLKYNNWNEVSIDLFYKIKAASEEKRDMEVIALLCDTTEEEIGRLSISDYNRLVGDTQWISDFSFNTSSYPSTVKIGEQTLKVNLNLVEFSISQYIDFSNFYSKNELEKYYGNILATFLIPKGKKYGEDYDVIALAKEIQENLSITAANNLMFFFSGRIEEIVKSYPTIFKGKPEDEEAGERKADQGGGDAGTTSTFTWFSLLDVVSSVTLLDWHKVLEMNVLEFFNIVSYRKEKDRLQELQLKSLRTH